ncbi:hypothetical protein M9Y10_028410 [Tritrichomonas musculus]|uniref:EF-hand domain-containing protein n=1 Tax=Tritrichomonas musculus TaxID=1915356 RepID=A0ABR2KJ85_9EUKA
MNPSEAARKRTLEQMMLVAQREKLTIMSPRDNPKIPYQMSEFDFRNTILDFPMTISPDDLAKIVEYYKEGRRINYGKFVDDLLASAPSSSSGSNEEANSPTRHINPHYVALARFLHDRNTDLITLIEFMDRNKNGKITAENFARCLTDFPEAVDVAKITMDLKTKEIDYIKLQKLLKTIKIGPLITKKDPVDSNTLPKCFSVFSHLINERSIQIDEYFLREHRTKTGLMPKDRFFSLLYQLDLPMPREDIQQIADFFADKDGNVDYQQFVSTVVVKDEDTYTPPPPVVDTQAVIDKIIKCFNNRKLNIWSIFKPHDKEGTGKVSTTLFLKIVNQFNVDTDPEELRLAVESMSDQETKTVDYIEFSKMVDKSVSVDFNETIESTLQKLRDFIKDKRVSLNRTLRGYDRDKSGLITTDQFLAGLRKIGYIIDEHDMKLISDNYEDKSLRHHILWRKLCEDVDVTNGDISGSGSVSLQSSASLSSYDNINYSSSLKELLTTNSPKQMPLYRIQDYEENGHLKKRESGPVPENLIPLYSEIAKCMNKFGFDLEGELISYDRFKKGIVSRTDFKQTLDLIPMLIPPAQLDDLIRYYCEEQTGKIYYLFFLHDLEEFGGKAESNQETEPSTQTEQETENKSEIKDETQNTENLNLTIGQRAKLKTNTLAAIPSWSDNNALKERSGFTETFESRMSRPVDNLPESVKPVLVKILEYTSEHAMTPREIFSHFDKYHNGLLETGALQVSFGPTGIYISPKEFDLLVEVFRDKERPDLVNYLMICNAINSLNKKDSMIGTIPLSETEEDEAWRAVNRVQTTLRNRRRSIKWLFINETKDTITTKDLFYRLEEVGRVSMTPEERRLLVKKYHVNARGDIDWRRLCEDSETTIRIV